MSDKKLIENLNKTYCRVAASKVHGVGVFAIRDIPSGVNPFEHTTSKCGVQKYKRIKKKSIMHLDKNVIKMLDDYLGINEDDYYDIPVEGLNSLDISFYLNHSDKNNLEIADLPDCNFVVFKTKRKIKKNEELFINYSNYDSK